MKRFQFESRLEMKGKEAHVTYGSVEGGAGRRSRRRTRGEFS